MLCTGFFSTHLEPLFVEIVILKSCVVNGAELCVSNVSSRCTVLVVIAISVRTEELTSATIRTSEEKKGNEGQPNKRQTVRQE